MELPFVEEFARCLPNPVDMVAESAKELVVSGVDSTKAHEAHYEGRWCRLRATGRQSGASRRAR